MCIRDRPQVAYKETFTKAVDVDSKYAKQSGGRGQYGHCKVHFEPMDANAEETFKFESTVVGGAIPKEYIPAVGAGIEEAAKSGILAGFPVLGVKATVYDGSYHEVDSNEMAFKIAGSMAFKEAMQKAGAILLEPIMKVEVTMPEEYMGDVIGDINSRRGRIEGMDDLGGGKIVRAYVPLSEMFGYSADLRSKTQGRGNYSMFFEKYEPVPKLSLIHILLELVDMEIRELLNEYEFPGDDTPIIQGSALKALEDPHGEWGDKIMELMDAVDSWIPDPQRETDKPFLMPVEDVFTITGRGTVATGRVERGVLHLNDEVEIVGCLLYTSRCV